MAGTRRNRQAGLPIVFAAATAFMLLAAANLRAQMPHEHVWESVNNLPDPAIMASPSVVEPLGLVQLAFYSENDADACTAAECTFPGATAANMVRPAAWTDNDAGGAFGHLDEFGQFVSTSNPELVTHYRAPDLTGGSGITVTLTVTSEDLPTAVDPASNLLISTHNDASADGITTVQVRLSGSAHVHSWSQTPELAGGSLSAGASAAVAGDVVPLQLTLADDLDTCGVADCPFFDSQAANTVQATAWSDGGRGGEFGFLDENGQFYPAANATAVTHYRCPDIDGLLTITATLDDVPQAVEPGTGLLIPTADDSSTTVSCYLNAGYGHTHAWEPVHNLPQPQIYLSPSQCLPGEPVAIGVYTGPSGGNDRDSCTNPDGVCGFQWEAANAVQVTAWSDLTSTGQPAGGQFGFLSSSGEFTVSQDPALITHYRATQTSDTLTLTATIDDVPLALDPLSGRLTSTWDDTSTQGVGSLTVGSGHTHLFTPIHNLPAPELRPDTGTAYAGQVIALSLRTSMDPDPCEMPNCPFGGTAYNQVVPTGWSDGGLGGAFGYLDEVGQFVTATDPLLVTHYRCPTATTSVTVTVTIDDVPFAVEPFFWTQIPTFDDQAAAGSVTIEVRDTGTHTHGWAAVHNLPPPALSTAEGAPAPGAVLAPSYSLGQDQDTCTVPGCSFVDATAANVTRPAGWADTTAQAAPAGGQFGYLDSVGQFVASTDPLQVTHYRCPENVGQVTLTLTVDDDPTATDPATLASIATFDDQPQSAGMEINVQDPDPHTHDWENDSNIPTPTIYLESNTVEPGGLVAISVAAQQDNDLCLDTDQLPCAFPNLTAANAVYLAGWGDASGEGQSGGGEFGYLDELGQFTPSSDPALVTHYRAPQLPAGTTELNLTLGAVAEDVPVAPEPSGSVVPTFNDGGESGVAALAVSYTSPHTHLFEAKNNLNPGTIQVGSPRRGGTVVSLEQGDSKFPNRTATGSKRYG